MAVQNGFMEVVSLLLKSSADIAIRTHFGHSVLDLVKLYGFDDELEALFRQLKCIKESATPSPLTTLLDDDTDTDTEPKEEDQAPQDTPAPIASVNKTCSRAL